MARKQRSKTTPSVRRLAHVFAAVAAAGAATDSKAAAILVLARGIPDVKTFDQSVRAAYKVNGWNVKSGRPVNGSSAGAVPATVKQYVSQVRAGLRMGLKMGHYETFHSLKKAIAARREKTQKRRAGPPDKNTEGVHLVKGDALTGVPFHDLVVLYDKLANGKKMALAAAVQRLVKQFQPSVQLVLAPLERKAA
jgi:hypothetical protein